MSGVPVEALVGLGLLALVLAAALAAAGSAVVSVHRGDLTALESSTLPSARRILRLAGEERRVASAATGLRVLSEAVALVCLVLVLAAAGLGWWQVLLVAVPVAGVLGLALVRGAAREVGARHPVGTLVVTSGLLVVARAAATPVRAIRRPADDREDDFSEEIRDMVERVSDAEHIEEEDREMFRSVLELGETITRAVMVPRTAMITVPSGTPVHKALTLFLRSGFSRIPVVGESVDDLLGVVYLKDVIRRRHGGEGSDDEPIDVVARPPVFVPESKPVDELLREMQRGAAHIAMVVDEFGGIAGLVTMEDALEEIVGELTDEHDTAGPEVEELDDGGYRVPSGMPVDELGDLFDLELEDDDVDTAGGLLAKALGKVPLAGSSAEVGGLVLVADRVQGRRKQLATLRVRRTDDVAPQPGADPSTTASSSTPSSPPSSQGAHR